MDAMGHDAPGLVRLGRRGTAGQRRNGWPPQFNYLRACTIYGGSNEIQKNIVAKHILRLPTA